MMDFSSDPYVAEQQIRAVIFCLVAFAYIDSDFALSEKEFIREYLAQLADGRAKEKLGDLPREDIVDKWTKHYHELLDEYDNLIRGHFTESVSDGENIEQFVLAKLKLGCFEVLNHFDGDGQQAILATVRDLMHADGTVAPQEEKFIAEIVALIAKPIELDMADIEPIDEGAVIINDAYALDVRVPNHPWFSSFEWDFSKDKETFDIQSAGDQDLCKRVMRLFDEQRELGKGKLAAANTFADFAGQDAFLDEHVYVLPPKPNRDYELLVIGDLHGCYSCLKAALMQADVFQKVQAFRDDPENNPGMYVVFLGDYIDRGRFSYSGILRIVMQLAMNMPGNVFMLRGNHEYYVELQGRVLAPVRPCEAMNSIAKVADTDVFRGYMNLFEALPNMLVFGETLFVHGGIPRGDSIEEKWQGLHSLNDNDIRFQMMWSDPSEVDSVPIDLQKENARFPFGRQQFQQFMAKIGCKTMVRGHERVLSGFSKIYDDPQGVLVSLFSAGGEHNEDLPKKSNYRKVTPAALTLRYHDGVTTLSPFLLDYQRYNDPKYNAFF
jgi:hypothetical protein